MITSCKSHNILTYAAFVIHIEGFYFRVHSYTSATNSTIVHHSNTVVTAISEAV